MTVSDVRTSRRTPVTRDGAAAVPPVMLVPSVNVQSLMGRQLSTCVAGLLSRHGATGLLDIVDEYVESTPKSCSVSCKLLRDRFAEISE